jgi:hypothetical protein
MPADGSAALRGPGGPARRAGRRRRRARRAGRPGGCRVLGPLRLPLQALLAVGRRQRWGPRRRTTGLCPGLACRTVVVTPLGHALQGLHPVSLVGSAPSRCVAPPPSRPSSRAAQACACAGRPPLAGHWSRHPLWALWAAPGGPGFAPATLRLAAGERRQQQRRPCLRPVRHAPAWPHARAAERGAWGTCRCGLGTVVH